MKILLTDITTKNHRFSIEELVPFLEEGVGARAEIQASFVLKEQKEDVYRLNGNLKGLAFNSCGRCGKKVEFDIDEDFQYQFLLQEEPKLGAEHQCSDEDCELVYLTHPEIECSEILSEQLFLALPTHIVCTDDCKGLCDQCGVDLNKEKCTCKEINKNSPFAILKSLQKN